MIQQQTSNEKICDFPVNTKSDVYIDMMYQGKPIPIWLQEPVFETNAKDAQEKFPEWLQEPAKIS